MQIERAMGVLSRPESFTIGEVENAYDCWSHHMDQLSTAIKLADNSFSKTLDNNIAMGLYHHKGTKLLVDPPDEIVKQN